MLRSGWTACIVVAALAAAGVASSEDDLDDLDDLMGGFGDEFDESVLDSSDKGPPDWIAALPYGAEIWDRVDLGGSIGAGAVYNLHSHKVPNPDAPYATTSWDGLSRLDLDGDLQLDVQLPYEWMIRAEGNGFFDFAYLIKGRSNYSNLTLDVLEWQVDTGEVYIAGPLHDHVDLTLGRKVVNWGRSDTFRIVDVVNPLDNREPGLVDIEELRRPVTMAKLDFSKGPWGATFLVIPEARYERGAPPGSDFYPNAATQIFFPSPGGTFPILPISGRSGFGGNPGLAGKLDANFSGWDLSLYGAYVDENQRVVDTNRFRLEPNRFSLLGAAGNYALGSWLVKFELGWRSDIRVLRLRANSPLPYSDDKDRIDTMVGIEWYGPDNLTMAFEVVNRHLLDYSRGTNNPPQLVEQSTFETGLRLTRPFFNERLEVTGLVVVVGERLQDGALLRISGDYEIADGWNFSGGVIAYIEGPDKGIGGFDDNDRLFAEIDYSF